MIFLSGLVALAATQNPFGLGGMPGGLPANSSNVRFQTVAQGTDLTTNTPGLFVLNNPVAWNNYWRANHPGAGPFLEQGFFNNWRLVAIHAGVRPSAGYGLCVLRIDRRIDRAVVSALETVPPARRDRRGRDGDDGRGRRQPTFPTSPWLLLRVERGAFDLVLQTQQVEGYPAGQVGSGPGGKSITIDGTTIIFAPGYGPP